MCTIVPSWRQSRLAYARNGYGFAELVNSSDEIRLMITHESQCVYKHLLA